MQLHDNARGLRARRTYPKSLLCGVAAALAFSTLGASSALASDDFSRGFEEELGRVTAWGIARAVFNAPRLHAVRDLPEITYYHSDHGRRHHYYEVRRYAHPEHVHGRYCDHREAHWKAGRRDHRQHYTRHRGRSVYYSEHREHREHESDRRRDRRRGDSGRRSDRHF